MQSKNTFYLSALQEMIGSRLLSSTNRVRTAMTTTGFANAFSETFQLCQRKRNGAEKL